ncbi:Antifungal protein [Colletotrichum tropicale]|nr:Antifungal protein [Colletotrichum tropicale]
MQIAKVAFFLFAAIGVAANPVDVDGSGIDAGVSGGGRNYKEDTCKFKGQKGKTTIVRCPRFANQRLQADYQVQL